MLNGQVVGYTNRSEGGAGLQLGPVAQGVWGWGEEEGVFGGEGVWWGERGWVWGEGWVGVGLVQSLGVGMQNLRKPTTHTLKPTNYSPSNHLFYTTHTYTYTPTPTHTQTHTHTQVMVQYN